MYFARISLHFSCRSWFSERNLFNAFHVILYLHVEWVQSRFFSFAIPLKGYFSIPTVHSKSLKVHKKKWNSFLLNALNLRRKLVFFDKVIDDGFRATSFSDMGELNVDDLTTDEIYWKFVNDPAKTWALTHEWTKN